MAKGIEIEAKFNVADEAVFARLLRAKKMGTFHLVVGPTHRVEDIYQDTAGWHIYRGGYAFRLRKEGKSWTTYLKGLGHAQRAIHEREEWEEPLPHFEANPVRWPDNEAREKVLSLTQGAPVRRLFALRQARYTRILFDQTRQVAELSLDRVRVQARGRTEAYLELEAELLPDGNRADMQRLVDCLENEWHLEPQPKSKFQRALAMLGLDPTADGETARSAEVWGAQFGSGAECHAEPGEASRLAGTETLRFTQGDIERVSAPKLECARGQVEMAHRPVLKRIAETEAPLYARRARLLLSWDEDVSIPELQQQLGYSRSSVYFWLHAYSRDGLGVFPEGIMARIQPVVLPSSSVGAGEMTTEGPLNSPIVSDDQAPIYLLELCRRYGVDMGHAHHVAMLALALFDFTAPVHRLSVTARDLLEKGAVLHNVGLASDPARHHLAGRDIVLENPLVELTDEERQMVATMIFLHRKAITKKKLQDDLVTSLPEGRRQEMLELAALIRIADGLDYSLSQTTRISRGNVSPAGIEVFLTGPYARDDAARAEEKADLWNTLHAVRFRFHSLDEGVPLRERDEGLIDTATVVDESQAEAASGSEVLPQAAAFDAPPEWPLLAGWAEENATGLLADEPMSEAGRKVFRFHLIRMLQHEPGTRRGEDIEEVHDMRVAARRLRSAFRIFGDFFVPEALAPFGKGLRRTGRALGAVRDLDVLIAKANDYLATLPAHQQDGLTPLLNAWRAEREAARQRLVDYLSGENYRQFVRAFAEFVITAGAGARSADPVHPEPYLVQHVVPRLLYSHFEVVRAYEAWLNDPPLELLHALRIDCKRLRYALEFFREVLGREMKDVIEQVVSVQDHLGELHDADVADRLLRDFLDGGTGAPVAWPPPRKQVETARRRIVAPGVALYLVAKQEELHRLLATFPETWARLNCPKVRQNLAVAVSVL